MGVEDVGRRGSRADGRPLRGVSEELAERTRGWRRNLKPEQIPGFDKHLRNKTHLSQDDVARLVGVSATWYGDLERGRQGGYSDDFLDRVSSVLRLSDAERRVLYFLALGREPSRSHAPSTEVSSDYQALVDMQPIPAYISDVAWDVLYHNQHVADWFPWLPREPNVMRWTFTYPEARTQLVNWEQDWAAPMIAQMAFVQAQVHNDRLNELVEEIKEHNEDARRLWEGRSGVKPHPDEDVRWMYVPYRPDPIPVTILASAPLHDLTQRIIYLVPKSADANPGIVIPRRTPATDVYPAGPETRRLRTPTNRPGASSPAPPADPSRP